MEVSPNYVALVLARAPPQPQAPERDQGLFSPGFIMVMIIMIGAFYLLIHKPQQRQQAERHKQLEGLQKGDKVVSAGGIHGTVVRSNKNKNTVHVQVAKGVEMEFNKSSLTVVREKAGGKPAEEEPAEEESEAVRK